MASVLFILKARLIIKEGVQSQLCPSLVGAAETDCRASVSLSVQFFPLTQQGVVRATWTGLPGQERAWHTAGTEGHTPALSLTPADKPLPCGCLVSVLHPRLSSVSWSLCPCSPWQSSACRAPQHGESSPHSVREGIPDPRARHPWTCSSPLQREGRGSDKRKDCVLSREGQEPGGAERSNHGAGAPWKLPGPVLEDPRFECLLFLGASPLLTSPARHPPRTGIFLLPAGLGPWHGPGRSCQSGLINYGHHNTSCLSARTVPAACPHWALQRPGQLPGDSSHCAPGDTEEKRLGWWLEIAGRGRRGAALSGKE